MPRLIDAYALLKPLYNDLARWQDSASEYEEDRSGVTAMKEAINAVTAAPTVDAEPMVHCGECEYLMFSDMYGECSKGHLGIVSPNDYCSRGKRKDGDCDDPPVED